MATRRTKKAKTRKGKARKHSKKTARKHVKRGARKVVRKGGVRKSHRKPAHRKGKKGMKRGMRRTSARRGIKKSVRKSAKKGVRRVKAKANRRRHSYRRNNVAAFKALLKPFVSVIAGFAAHSIATKLLSEQLSKSAPSVSKYSRTITGLGLAVAGFFGLDKFMPAHAKEVGLGLFASAVTGAIKELAPEAGKTLGLGTDVTLLPRYSVQGYSPRNEMYGTAAASPYYQAAAASPYLQAAAATPYLQAAAGVGTDGIGEYFSRDITAVGTGEYFARNIQVHGYGDYEISSNYAGMEASPNTVDTWVPSENAQAIGSGPVESGGVFGGSGNGIF